MQVIEDLAHKKLCTILNGMTDPREVFKSLTGKRVTSVDIAEMLDVSRNTVQTWIKEGFAADEIIKVARELNINPTEALVELGKLTAKEVTDFIEGGCTLLELASLETLIQQLAKVGLNAEELAELSNDGLQRLEKKWELQLKELKESNTENTQANMADVAHLDEKRNTTVQPGQYDPEHENAVDLATSDPGEIAADGSINETDAAYDEQDTDNAR